MGTRLYRDRKANSCGIFSEISALLGIHHITLRLGSSSLGTEVCVSAATLQYLYWEVNIALSPGYIANSMTVRSKVCSTFIKENQHCLYSGITLRATLRQVTWHRKRQTLWYRFCQGGTPRGYQDFTTLVQRTPRDQWLHTLTAIKATSWHLQAISHGGGGAMISEAPGWISRQFLPCKYTENSQKSHAANGQSSMIQSMWADKITVL